MVTAQPQKKRDTVAEMVTSLDRTNQVITLLTSAMAEICRCDVSLIGAAEMQNIATLTLTQAHQVFAQLKREVANA